MLCGGNYLGGPTGDYNGRFIPTRIRLLGQGCFQLDQSRKTYDQTGTIEDHEFNEQYFNTMRRGSGQEEESKKWLL